jgi:hypothetical protein
MALVTEKNCLDMNHQVHIQSVVFVPVGGIYKKLKNFIPHFQKHKMINLVK